MAPHPHTIFCWSGSPFTVHFCAGFRTKGHQSSLMEASRETLKKITHGPPGLGSPTSQNTTAARLLFQNKPPLVPPTSFSHWLTSTQPTEAPSGLVLAKTGSSGGALHTSSHHSCGQRTGNASGRSARKSCHIPGRQQDGDVRTLTYLITQFL